MTIEVNAERIRELVAKEMREFAQLGRTYSGCRIPIGRIGGIDINLELTRDHDFDRRPTKLVCVKAAK